MKNVQKFRKVIRGKYKRLAKIVIKRKEYLKISEEDESDIKDVGRCRDQKEL